MTERDLQDNVIALLKLHGYRVYHPWSSIHSEAGWPDLAAVKDGRLLFIECKTEKGRVTKAQRQWLTELDGVKVVDAFVLRPGPLDELEEMVR